MEMRWERVGKWQKRWNLKKRTMEAMVRDRVKRVRQGQRRTVRGEGEKGISDSSTGRVGSESFCGSGRWVWRAMAAEEGEERVLLGVFEDEGH